MNKQELTAMVAEILGQIDLPEPMVKGSDYKPTVSNPEKKVPAYSDGAFVPDVTALDLRKLYLTEAPENPEKYRKMKEKTPARLGSGKAGPRYRTLTMLRFRADHAAAQDSVFSEVDAEFAKKHDLLPTKTRCDSKDEYLTRPDLGRCFDEHNAKTIKGVIDTPPRVQIVIGDGLSSAAIEANAMDCLAAIKDGLKNPRNVKFVIKSGNGDFATCAEMRFYVKNTELANDFSVFADDVYSTLKEGTTQADIDKISNTFVRTLAQRVFDGNYNTEYRVAEYKPYLHYDRLSEIFCTPGKRYSQYEGITGINITKGKHAVIVSGIPEGQTVDLKVMAWWVGKEGGNFDGGNPYPTNYALQNGINIIDYTYEYDGLAYIGYYTFDDPKALPNIKVHFVNGQVNGYLSPDKTNEEMYEICANARNYCMDISGTKVQQVWTSAGLRDYCKAMDGSLGYRQYIAAIDSLIQWEHDEIGFTKYGREPENRTMAYVNFTYYMFQGALGVSFHRDQEPRVLNCRTIMTRDDDAIWGLSHEWGHQHQMHPYLCWSGLGEVSNNIFSYYNIMHMGYNSSDKINDWPRARRLFFEDAETKDGKKVSSSRGFAYNNAKSNASLFSYSPKMRELCLAMKDSVVTSYASNPLRAVALHDVVPYQGNANSINVGYILNSFIMLGNYAKIHLQKPGAAEGTKYLDFYPDLFESLRRMGYEGGSDLEKQDGWDKYELIFHAQYATHDNGYKLLKEKFPTSCWITDRYVDGQYRGDGENTVPAMLNFIRKASRLYGYNLFPYFERHGYLRNVALHVNDYSWGYYVMTMEMYNEFKADMDALVADGTLKEMPEGMVRDMMYCEDLNDKATGNTRYPTPNVPN